MSYMYINQLTSNILIKDPLMGDNKDAKTTVEFGGRTYKLCNIEKDLGFFETIFKKCYAFLYALIFREKESKICEELATGKKKLIAYVDITFLSKSGSEKITADIATKTIRQWNSPKIDEIRQLNQQSFKNMIRKLYDEAMKLPRATQEQLDQLSKVSTYKQACKILGVNELPSLHPNVRLTAEEQNKLTNIPLLINYTSLGWGIQGDRCSWEISFDQDPQEVEKIFKNSEQFIEKNYTMQGKEVIFTRNSYAQVSPQYAVHNKLGLTFHLGLNHPFLNNQ